MPPQRPEPRAKEPLLLSEEDAARAIAAVRYVGSPEHKKGTSFAGVPRTRADSSICPARFASRQDELTEWLRAAIRLGLTGTPKLGIYPRHVWCHEEGQWFEGRLTNQGLGEYKGWPVTEEEVPLWVIKRNA